MKVTLDRALSDKKLLGLGGPSWLTWRAVLKAAYCEPLTPAERAAFDQVSGGRKPPTRKVKQLCAVVSRRAGKGRVAAGLATYASALMDHRAVLAPGERGIVACLSPTRAQAGIVKDYTLGYFEASPILRDEVADTTSDEIRLQNGNTICTLASDFRTLRGRTLLLAILDEASFLHSDTTAASDIETARALLPGLATTNGMLVTISSPYRRSGLVFETHRNFFGIDSDDCLVVSGASLLFNPTLDVAMIEAAAKDDPESARAEWFGEFRTDLSQFLPDALIDAAIDHNRPLELPPQPGVVYIAFVDSSGGTGHDSYTIAIGHRAADRTCVLDLVRGTDGPFDPAVVTAEYAKLAREYGIATVTGDFHAAGWVGGSWKDCGVGYQRSELNKSAIYLEVVALFTRGIMRLSNHTTLLRELRSLERRTGRGGKDTIDHPPRGSDDYSNAACGCLVLASGAQPSLWTPEMLLGPEGRPVPMPIGIKVVFAVIVAGERETGVVYFALGHGDNPLLWIIDVTVGPLTPALLHGTAARLVELLQVTHARDAKAFVPGFIGAELERLGYGVGGVIDPMIAEGAQALALSAATHVGARRIKVVTGKAEQTLFPFLSGVARADADPLTLAALAGVALGLDRGRSL